MKKIVAMREKKKNRSKGYSIMLGIFGIISFLFGLVCIINPMKENSMPTMGIILVIMGAVMGLLIIIILKVGKQITKTNSYPQEAVVIEDEMLYILTDKLTKIPLHDIKKVSYSREQALGVFVRVVYTRGTLVIHCSSQKYTLTQISNVAESAKLIRAHLKSIK